MKIRQCDNAVMSNSSNSDNVNKAFNTSLIAADH